MENLIEAVLEDDFSDDLAMVGRIADVISQVCLPLFDTSVGCGDMTSLENNRVGSVFLPSILPITQEYACILICWYLLLMNGCGFYLEVIQCLNSYRQIIEAVAVVPLKR